MPAISSICVTHRKGALLRQTLEALVGQLAPGDEVVVIDDGGDDRAIFEAVRARHPRLSAAGSLRYVSVPHKGYRLALLCNIGVMLARHERIVKLDGDVVPRPGWLPAYRRELRSGALVCGRIEWRLEDGRLVRDSRFDYATREGCVGARKSYGGNLGFSRSDLLAVGLFTTRYNGAWGAEDADVGEKYRVSGRAVRYAFDAVGEHQWHPPSPFRSGANRNRRLFRNRVRAFAAGRRPTPSRRDVLQVVAEEGSPGVDLQPLLEELGPACEFRREPLARVAARLDADSFVLLLGGRSVPSPGTVDALYAYLKAEPRCEGVTAGEDCVLLRGSGARRMAAGPWSGVRVLPAQHAPPRTQTPRSHAQAGERSDGASRAVGSAIAVRPEAPR